MPSKNFKEKKNNNSFELSMDDQINIIDGSKYR